MGSLFNCLTTGQFLSMTRYMVGYFSVLNSKGLPNNEKSESKNVCEYMLKKTSRSFAMVICTLHEELSWPVCIFYLVLRALDTIEDDMTIVPLSKKIAYLEEFYTHLIDRKWTFNENGPDEKDRDLLVQFNKVTNIYLELKPEYQDIIKKYTIKMADGMTIFLKKENTRINTIAEWNDYCYYVAGLVGLGLSELFYISGLENSTIVQKKKLSISMGLFLQKINIIRDYLEDIETKRFFWPKEVWGKYVNEQEDLVLPEHENQALLCLDELIFDALGHVEDCIEYLGCLKEKTVLRFCAIPQVMAVGTMALCFHNIKVFKGVVKMKRSQTVDFMMRCDSLESIKDIFRDCLNEIRDRILKADSKYLIYQLERVDKLLEFLSVSSENKNMIKYVYNSVHNFITKSSLYRTTKMFALVTTVFFCGRMIMKRK